MQMDRSVALQYSGGARPASTSMGILLEFEVGAIDCGAGLDSLSQYQGAAPVELEPSSFCVECLHSKRFCPAGEEEVLFGPLSHMEVVEEPFIEDYNGGQACTD